MRPLKTFLIASFLTVGLLTGLTSGALGADKDDTADNKPLFTNGTVTLNSQIIVDDHLIRLGDLFTNAGQKANVAIAYAPKPGQRATFDARWLYKVARAYKLDWRPFSRMTQAVVERDSQLVDPKEIQAKITEALRSKGLEADMQVELSDAMPMLYIPGESDGSVAVEDIIYRPRSHRFSAIIASPANKPEAQRIRISGQVYQMIDLPVLQGRIARGDIIREKDITWTRVRADRLNYSVIEHESDLIGMTLRRTSRPGEPIRTRDLVKPTLVNKGEIVTVILEVGGMSLTTKAKALEPGSRNDSIRVANTKTKKNLDAIVIGSGLVKVEMTHQVAMSPEAR